MLTIWTSDSIEILLLTKRAKITPRFNSKLDLWKNVFKKVC